MAEIAFLVGIAGIRSIALWPEDTQRAMISIIWGGSALGITLFGFMRQSRMHRLFALVSFSAGVRVVIFIGVGLILLPLSFTYQKVSSRLLQPDKDEANGEK